MPLSNFKKMIQLATDVFDVKNDPDQLDVNEKVIERLHHIHPATVSEYNEGNGPLVWILLIPTTNHIMDKFLTGEISEQQLFDLTSVDTSYDAIYLCSAMVLEEYRRKGIAKRLTLEAIDSIRKDHPIKTLFVWPFSNEGEILAQGIAIKTSLPLLKRTA
jgi:ribosomal protein S18 acetylase RimI-like enzyme